MLGLVEGSLVFGLKFSGGIAVVKVCKETVVCCGVVGVIIDLSRPFEGVSVVVVLFILPIP